MKKNTDFRKNSFVFLLALCTLLSTSISRGQKLKIMPLGNSITYGESLLNDDPDYEIAYRWELYKLLIGAGYSFDFVGSEQSGFHYFQDSLDYTDNAGFPGIRPDQLTTLLRTGINQYGGDHCVLSSCPDNYLTVYDPDIILLHIGTNGLNDSTNAPIFRDSVNAILDIIDDYEVSTGKVIPVFLAQIINRQDNSGEPRHKPTLYYNDLLYNLVNSRSTDEVILVNMENALDYRYAIDGGDMEDTWHPDTATGYKKMAARWFAHMEAYNFRAPVISNIPNVTIKENETFKTINLNNYVFDPQDPDNEITWSFTPSPAVHFNISISNGVATISSKNPEWDGSENITFKAADSGHGGTPLFDTEVVTIYAQAINDPPVIQNQQSVTVEEDSQITVQFSHLVVDDPDNKYPDDFTLHVLPGSNYTIIGSYTVKPNSNYYGTIYVPVYVNDGQANSNTYNLMISVTSVNDKPWLNIPSNRTAFEDALFSMTISAGDVDIGDNLVLSSVNKPAWLSFNSATGSLTGTPHNNDVGSNSVTIRVSDGTVNVDSTFSITVINTNDDPYITSYPVNTTIYAGEYFEYLLTAMDSDLNDILSYSAITVPSFLSFGNDTHKLTGTPQKGDTGTYAVSLRVGDGTVFVYQNFNLQVKPKIHPPEITSIHINSVLEDSLYIYALKAKDLDGDILTYSEIEIPDWTTFYPSGILIGTPRNENVGFHDVVLSVTDGSFTVYDSFNIEVINVNDPPVIKGTSKILYTPKATSFELTLNDLLVEDVDNAYPDDFTLELFNGNNYTAVDHLIVPDTDFLGILDVTVSVDDGFDSAVAQIKLYVGVSSNKEYNGQNCSLFVYPVPAIENIHFKFNGLKENVLLTLYNSTLQPLKVVNVPAQTNELMIDVRDLPVGIVFYKIDYKLGVSSGSFILTR
jgi:hypothetical protein